MSTAGKLTLTTFLTLDGVMQAPGGPNEDTSGDFPHGGWLVPYFDDEMGQIVDRAFGRADAFLLGRKTYEIFANHWPRVTDPRDVVASTLNRQPKYVASRTLKHLEWHNSRLIQEDVAERVAGLKQEYRREIQVHGSGELAQTLLANDLVDEFHLWLFPVVLGSGKRLFSRGAIPASLALAGTRKTSTGVVVNSYQRVGKPAYGSFALDA
jgi:dihydrofolate reductase